MAVNLAPGVFKVNVKNPDDNNSGIIETTPGSVCLNSEHFDGEYFVNAGISLGSDGIKLTGSFSDNNSPEPESVEHVVTLGKDGFQYGDSEVLTHENIKDTNVLQTDDSGKLTRSELTIGNVEITETTYNYTLTGTLSIDGRHYNIEAISQGDEAEATGRDWDDHYSCYVFSITEAINEEGDFSECLNGETIYVPVYYFDNSQEKDDTFNFKNDLATLSYISVACNIDCSGIGNVTITRSIPFNLKKPSVLKVNGSKVITSSTLSEHSIIQDLLRRIEALETRVNNL